MPLLAYRTFTDTCTEKENMYGFEPFQEMEISVYFIGVRGLLGLQSTSSEGGSAGGVMCH